MRYLMIVAALATSILFASQVAGAAPPHGQWITDCNLTHTLNDDPIVFPGQPGASHQHSFFGNTATDANTTLESLMTVGKSKCRDIRERSAYWFPTLLDPQGQPVLTGQQAVTYWSQNGDAATTEMVPQGMNLVVGNRLATGPQPHVLWQCNPTGSIKPRSPKEDHPFDCTAWNSSLQVFFTLPSCWDGQDTTGSHFSYTPCRAPFTHRIVKVTVRYTLGIQDPTGYSFSSGSLWSAHMDFINAWLPGRQEDLMAKCLNIGVNCGAISNTKP